MDGYRGLTKYERTNVIGLRAEQLARGAQAFVPMPSAITGNTANEVFYKIAEEELDQKRLPFTVIRQLIDGSSMRIHLSSAKS